MKLLQRIVTSLGILALFLCLFAEPKPAHASTIGGMPTINAGSITTYAFEAKAGDSLSRIVRRALQLRGVVDQPSAMYCENIISSQLGGEYLEVSQQVVVNFSQIDNCVSAAKNLDANQRAAWQTYADNVIFDVSDISPTNNSSNVVAPQQPTTPVPPAPSQTPTPQTTTPETPKKVSTPTKPSNSRLKKFVPGLYYFASAVVIIYFILKPSQKNRSNS